MEKQMNKEYLKALEELKEINNKLIEEYEKTLQKSEKIIKLLVTLVKMYEEKKS